MTPDTEKWLSKVKALLRKAESTDSPEEAEALTAKATALMAKFAIPQMLVDREEDQPEGVIKVMYKLTIPYAKPKLYLLMYVAQALGADCYYLNLSAQERISRYGWDERHSYYAFIVGFEDDISRVAMFYESLVVQMDRARKFESADNLRFQMLGRGDRRIWHASFIRGYASRIGQRMKAVYQQAAEEHSGEAALVLVNRSKQVEAEMKNLHLLRSRSSGGSHDGYAAQRGQAAADQAHFGGELSS